MPAEPSQRTGEDSGARDAPAPSLRAALPRSPNMGSRWLVLKAAERLWEVVQCRWFEAGYVSKLPTRRALCDAGVVQMTSAENFWYVLECIDLRAGYLARAIHKMALSEAPERLLPNSGDAMTNNI